MKPCIACRQIKQLDEFYRHPMMKDGYLNKCKECVKDYMKERARKNPAVQAYDRRRSRTDKRRKHLRENAKQWNKQNPDGYKAHNAVNNALRDGKLKKEPCLGCGTINRVHAHHSDYSKPLDVVWLCAKCHQRMHSALAEYERERAAGGILLQLRGKNAS